MQLYARETEGGWQLFRPGQVVWFGDARTASWGIWPEEEKIDKGLLPAVYVDEAPTRSHQPGRETFTRVGNQVEIRREWLAPDLDDLKDDALDALEAERLRCQALAAAGLQDGDVPSPEKLALYARKAWWASTGALALLAPEAGSLGLAPEALRDVILAKAAAADSKISSIEAARVSALGTIMACTDGPAIDAALEAAVRSLRSAL